MLEESGKGNKNRNESNNRPQHGVKLSTHTMLNKITIKHSRFQKASALKQFINFFSFFLQILFFLALNSRAGSFKFHEAGWSIKTGHVLSY